MPAYRDVKFIEGCAHDDLQDVRFFTANERSSRHRDHARLEWRVMVSPTPPDGTAKEPWVFVHARTRDFRYRCRVGRPWTTVMATPTLTLLVAELAAEAEQQLAEQAAGTP